VATWDGWPSRRGSLPRSDEIGHQTMHQTDAQDNGAPPTPVKHRRTNSATTSGWRRPPKPAGPPRCGPFGRCRKSSTVAGGPFDQKAVEVPHSPPARSLATIPAQRGVSEPRCRSFIGWQRNETYVPKATQEDRQHEGSLPPMRMPETADRDTSEGAREQIKHIGANAAKERPSDRCSGKKLVAISEAR